MAPLPLVAHFRSDFLPVLMPVDTDDTMTVVAEKVGSLCIGTHFPARDSAKQVLFKGDVLPSDTTVAEAGMGLMDYIEVRYVSE
jgi:toluene monooxygenase system protein B